MFLEQNRSDPICVGGGFIRSDPNVRREKLTKGNINLSGLNNDAGWTTNVGTVTSVGVGTGLDVSNASTTPSISLDLSELTVYWAAVAVLHDEGKVVVGAMRRDSSKEKRIRNDRGEDTERDSFWKLKIKHGYLFDGETEDSKAPWPSQLTIDVHTGLLADDVLELRRRVRSAGPVYAV